MSPWPTCTSVQLRDTLEQVGLIAMGVATVGLMAMWLAD
jgi:hypothetical protein